MKMAWTYDRDCPEQQRVAQGPLQPGVIKIAMADRRLHWGYGCRVAADWSFHDHRYTAKSFCKLWDQIPAFVKSTERLSLYTLDELHARTIPN
jgi:hypothetical protein